MTSALFLSAIFLTYVVECFKVTVAVLSLLYEQFHFQGRIAAVVSSTEQTMVKESFNISVISLSFY